jgi:hypothetical protein
MYYGGEAPTEAGDTAGAPRPAKPVDEGTPRFRDIVLSRILCRGAGRAVVLEGLPEMAISGIVLEDVRMSARRGLMAVDAEGIALRRVEIAAEAGPALSLINSRNVKVDGGSAAPGTGVFLRVDGASSGGITLSGVDTSGATTPVETGPGVAAGAVARK